MEVLLKCHSPHDILQSFHLNFFQRLSHVLDPFIGHLLEVNTKYTDANLLCDFLPHGLYKILLRRVQRTGKHEVLPNLTQEQTNALYLKRVTGGALHMTSLPWFHTRHTGCRRGPARKRRPPTLSKRSYWPSEQTGAGRWSWNHKIMSELNRIHSTRLF